MASPAAMPSPNFLSDNHSFVAVEEHGEDRGDEEEYDVHDSENPGRFQHGAVLIDVGGP